jgi:hypothetical protein
MQQYNALTIYSGPGRQPHRRAKQIQGSDPLHQILRPTTFPSGFYAFGMTNIRDISKFWEDIPVHIQTIIT